MDRETIILFGLLGVVVIVLIVSITSFVWSRPSFEVAPATLNSPTINVFPSTSQSASPSASRTKTSAGEVSVDITPASFAGGRFVMKMGVNTHTLNTLNTYDLTKLITLEVNGKTYKPVSALSLQGHHNQGELVFAVPEEPVKFTVTIDGLHEPKLRVFSWP